MKIVLALAASLFLFGCSDGVVDRTNEIAVSKEVVKNRKIYAKDIIHATNECIKSASTLTHLAVASNDQAETVEVCTKSAQKAYGAYSPYYENVLLEFAAQ